jgi:outer membrane receptor protein involved in Fe transport
LELGATNQTITVSATNVSLETENATQGQVIENKEILDLPLNGRNFMQLASLGSGVTPQTSATGSQIATWSGVPNTAVSIGGLREEDISYPYDGVETRNSWLGAIGILPSIDAIQEFKVQETGSSAAFGGGGAFVNVVTKSGSNALHGTAYEFVRNNDLDARNFFDIGPPPPFRQNQFGASMGGPIIKNKVFFFANYEGFRQSQPLDTYTRVPTAAQDQGNFSAFSFQLTNPFTGTPFQGNIIPPSLISPIGQKILSYYPAPNGNYPGNLNFFTVEVQPFNWDQASGRVDYYASDKDRVFFRYSWEDGTITIPGIDPIAYSAYPSNPRNLAVGWSRTISPTMMNDFRLGWNSSWAGEIRANGYNTTMENPLDLNYPQPSPGAYGLPALYVSGYANPGPFQGTTIIKENMFLATDSLTFQKGKHSISVGGEVRYDPIYQDENWDAPNITFNGSYTGEPVGDILVGIPLTAGAAIGDPTLHWRRWYQAYYVQDNVKLSHNLTLNLGLRWEYNQPPVDTRNHVGTFDTATDTMLSYPATKVLGLGREMQLPDYDDFAPRIELAWVPFGKNTVIRAGYGKYFLQMNTNYFWEEVNTPEFYSAYTYANPSPGQPVKFPLSQLFNPNEPTSDQLFEFEEPHNKTPYAQEWNLSIEHTFGRNWLLELSYNGSTGTHIGSRPNIDTPNSQGVFPYPNYGAIVAGAAEGISNYNALGVRVEKRYSSGLSLLSSYTYSKCLNTPWENQNTAHDYDIFADYGNCVYDLNQRFVVSSVYELPVGKGKPYLNQGGLTNSILGGWEVSGITQFSSGAWATAYGSQYIGNYNAALPNMIGPVNSSSLRSSIRKDNLGPYFNVNSFQAITAPYTQGDASYCNIKGPGINNWDLSVFKQWPLFERSSLTFRTDFFNAFNHAQFNGLSTGISAPNFGYITSAGPAREIQFSLRLVF